MDTEQKITCPLCKDKVSQLVFQYHVESERNVLEKIKYGNPGWVEKNGACSRCIDYYEIKIDRLGGIIPEAGPFFPVKSPDDFYVIPTPVRLNADPKYTGKGITICFIDSGFYPHPDITKTNNRILKIVDITNPKNTEKYFSKPHNESWHGTMTTVACAGNGYLSNGLFKGIASDANLVLIKTQDENGHITDASIAKAIKWANRNKNKFNIKIINLSVCSDEPVSYLHSEVDKAAEEAIANGISVVAAVGNDENAGIKPPANSPNVIAVGGYNDNNTLDKNNFELYHSTYGQTVDGFHKPELIAHSIWIAAPILPNTKEKTEAEKLHSEFKKKPTEDLKNKIQQTKYFSSHYMHVDGTSFAAPIISSVIAQILEANPGLTTQQVREIILSTATKLSGASINRQGFGLINARKAVAMALHVNGGENVIASPQINLKNKTVTFFHKESNAEKIVLSASFNNWSRNENFFVPVKNGLWKIEIPIPEKGTHQYKFLIDEATWKPDIYNPMRESDGFNDWNSKLIIQ
ncbi:MAG: S8 family serine peptidase [Bacteroidia bacterium]